MLTVAITQLQRDSGREGKKKKWKLIAIDRTTVENNDWCNYCTAIVVASAIIVATMSVNDKSAKTLMWTKHMHTYTHMYIYTMCKRIMPTNIPLEIALK